MFEARAPLKWFRNGEELKATDKISFKFVDDKQQMIIRDCTLEDAGEYMAVHKDMQTKAKLVVNEGIVPRSVNNDQTITLLQQPSTRRKLMTLTPNLLGILENHSVSKFHLKVINSIVSLYI